MGFYRLLISKLTIATIICACYAKDAPSVNNELGTITGLTRNVNVDGKEIAVNRFLGIPYAKAPVGELRFKKPEPLEKLNSPFQATEFGPACYQTQMAPFVLTEVMSEDCLFLNVFVPDTEPDNPRGHAVMFFLHGGAFAFGSGKAYNGDTLAARGNVIVVTINYRLSRLGFLTTGDSNAPGNVGLWDQHLALQWVNKHIGSFGGDKVRVTLFGESAGSMCAFHQGLSSLNKGLFQRIIGQSGTPTIKMMMTWDPSVHLNSVADEFNCDKTSSNTIMECLRDVSADDMYKTAQQVIDEDVWKMFEVTPLPTVDGDLIRGNPEELLNRGADDAGEELEFLRSLDVMIGFNSAEGAGSIYLMQNDTDNFLPSREEMNNEYIEGTIQSILGENVPDLVKKLVIAEYTNWDNPDDPKAVRQELARLFGDVEMKYAHLDFCNLLAKFPGLGETYLYYFDVKPSGALMEQVSWIEGADHGDELGFVFGFDEYFLSEVAKLRDLKAKLEPASWEYDVSYQIIRYWTNFAKTGSPNSAESQDPVWEQYDKQEKKCLHIKKVPTDTVLRKNLFAREEHFWLDVIPEVMRSCGSVHAPESPFVTKSEETCSKEEGCGGE